MKKKSKNPKLGSTFDSWLDEEGADFKAEVIAGAMKRCFVMEVRDVMKEKRMGVNALQRLLATGPSQIQRLLDPEDIGISLKSMARVAAILRLKGPIVLKP